MEKTRTWTSQVTLRGYEPGIMFDRYPGANNTKLAPQDKMHLDAEGYVYLPAANVMSLLTAVNTKSAPKLIYDPRKYGEKCQALLGYLRVTPHMIPITRNGARVQWLGEFDRGFEGPSGIILLSHVARLPKNIPNPKERPAILAPWEATLQIELRENPWVESTEFQNILEQGMAVLGLGTYRGVWGKAAVDWS